MLLNAMKLGPYELNDVPVLVENRGDAHKSRPAPKLVITLDLENGLLHLQ